MKVLIPLALIISLLSGILTRSFGQDTLAQDPVSNIVMDSVSMVDSLASAVAPSGAEKLDLKPPSMRDVVTAGKIVWTIVFLIAGYFIIRILSRILGFFAERSTSHRITLKSLIPLVRIFGWAVVIFIILTAIIQPPQSTVIALSASIGVALGLGAQDIIKNIFGGIVILIERPFKMGDKIEVGNYYGEVVEIGLRSTQIVTPDDSLVTVPNSELMNQSISNSNAGEPNCQVVAEIYLPLEIDTARVRQIATEAAQVSRYVYLNKPITVVFTQEIKGLAILYKMKLKAYVLDLRDEFIFKSDMTEIVTKHLVEEGLIRSDKTLSF